MPQFMEHNEIKVIFEVQVVKISLVKEEPRYRQGQILKLSLD